MLERLRRRLESVQDDALLRELLQDAGEFILAYTGRDEVPAALESAQVRLAVILYDRMGMEGEARRDEGGVTRCVDALPRDIAAMLNPYRLAKAVG